jgi:hypothetical protein
MTTTLQELVAAPTLEQTETDVANVLESAKFPVTAWAATQVGAGIINAIAYLWNSALAQAATVAKFNLYEYATGDLLTASASQNYGLTRESARATIGNVLVTGTVDNTYAAGEFTVAAGTSLYTNTSSFTVSSTGDTVEVQCTEPGSAGNRPGQTIVSTVANVTVTASSNYDWINTLGLDEESDPRLKTRITTSQLARADSAPVEFYQYWALATDPAITRVRVINSTYVDTGYNVVTRLATDFGTATSAQISAIDAVYQAKKPHGIYVQTTAATESVVTLTGTVYGVSESDLSARLMSLFTSHNPSDPLYDEEIIAAIGGRRAVVRYEEGDRALTSGQQIASADVYVLVNQITVQP